MACMIPDADKSSADSGKGQSDEDVFSGSAYNHRASSTFRFVPLILDKLPIQPEALLASPCRQDPRTLHCFLTNSPQEIVKVVAECLPQLIALHPSLRSAPLPSSPPPFPSHPNQA
ncbi:unnamed protein product [Rodentolepis nana]|uniref:Uncharacterized protein n=1 Tax=Rodentolepis nana TaxID=102285 RepID=A0A0R3T3I2_RODNA|nr:unnamed protein product [Rodentolepis nana]